MGVGSGAGGSIGGVVPGGGFVTGGGDVGGGGVDGNAGDGVGDGCRVETRVEKVRILVAGSVGMNGGFVGFLVGATVGICVGNVGFRWYM